jgi:hypothetical protein
MASTKSEILNYINLEILYQNPTIHLLFWIIAILVSVWWAKDGLLWDIEDKKEKEEEFKCYEKFSYFFSDFFISFFGWIALYLLLANIIVGQFDAFNIFLFTVAILGISGYGYKLAGKLTEEKEKSTGEE